MHLIKKLYRFLRERPLRATFFILPIVLLAIALVALVAGDEPAEQEASENAPLVTLLSLAELSNGSAALPLIGIIEPKAEADIQTQRSGTVTGVHYELGEYVPAGAIIASLNSQSEQASVAQAQAALASAEASRAQTLASIGRSSETTREEALSEYRNAYITATDAVENKTEPFFTNDRSAYPNFTIPSTNANAEDLEEARAEVSEILRAWDRALDDIALSSNLSTYLSSAINDLRVVEAFLNELASAVNRRTTSSGSTFDVSDSDRAALATARTSVSAQLATLIGVRDELQATLQQETGGTGEQQAEIATAEAGVAQAQANLDAALASLEETRVRSPISGLLNALPIKVGQSVGSFAPAATVINPDALEIVAYISPSDRSLVTVGSTVTLDTDKTGVVTHVAPGASSATGKIEIRIAPESTENLTAGNSVAVSIRGHIPQGTQENARPDFFSLPITAIKFKSDESVVFTLNEQQELVEHAVLVEQVLGSSARVSVDLTPETRIVADARGLVAGDMVEIAE